MFRKTATRVEENTWPAINESIREQALDRVAYYAAAPECDVRARLEQLDDEWDIERALEANASLAMLGSVVLGRLVNRRFYAVGAAVGVFLLQHALQGWCPPLPVLRRLGFRTPREIELERQSLLAAMRSRVCGSNGECFD